MGTISQLEKWINEFNSEATVQKYVQNVSPRFDQNNRQCPLIDDFLSDRSVATCAVRRLIGNPFSDPAVPADSDVLSKAKQQHEKLLWPVELRLKTLAAIEHATTAIDDGSCWTDLLNDYQTFFRTFDFEIPHGSVTPRQTAALLALQAEDSRGRTHEIARTLERVLYTEDTKPADPAKAFLVDTVAHLLQVDHHCKIWPTPSHSQELNMQYFPPGVTWVVLGSERAIQFLEDEPNKVGTYGILARLQLERIYAPEQRDVVGTIYPHPLMAWSTPLHPSFQDGIRDAFLATHQSDSTRYDIRWHLQPVSVSDNFRSKFAELLMKSGWVGNSQTTAFAAAIHSLRRNVPLRADAVASASFKATLSMSLDQELDTVQRIEEKTTAQRSKPMTDQDNQDLDKILSQSTCKKPVIEERVQELVVASTQTHKLLKPSMKLFCCSRFVDAFERLSMFERWSREHADRVTSNWNSKIQDMNDDDRLDLFQWPQLEWLKRKRDSGGGRAWIGKKVKGVDAQQLASIQRVLSETCKQLVIHDGAGAGKTVLSQKMEQLFTDEAEFQKFFPGKPRPMVVRWTKHTFPTLKEESKKEESKLEDLLMADSVIRSVCEKKKARRSWIRNAMELGRVLIIVDGLDELSDQQREILANLFTRLPQSHKETPETQRQSKVRWIVLGRPNTIRIERRQNQSSSNWLQDSHFLRVRLRLFNHKQRDNYFHMALGKLADSHESVPIKGSHAEPPQWNWKQWRRMVQRVRGANQQKILGLPATLREMLRLIEIHLSSPRSAEPWPKFRSLPDLFLKTSIPLLERNLEKVQFLTSGIPGPKEPEDQRRVIELAICSVAFEMWKGSHWGFTKPTGNQTHKSVVEQIENQAGKRFVRCYQTMKPLEGDQTCLNYWKWGYQRARQIVLNYFSKDDSEKATSLSFRNRKVHEQYVARFLTRYATPEDYEELSDHVGNPQWEILWDLVITTPLEQVVDGCDVEGAEPKRFSSALEWLFHRPTNSDWCRPTALMWQADQQCRRLLRSDTAHFEATRRKFREILHRQFLAILYQGTDSVQKQIAASLIDPDTYQILGKDSGSSLPFDNGEFLMGGDDPYIQRELIRDKVHVTLSRFGMQKLLISNAQFQLFDSNMISGDDMSLISENDRSRFAAPKQPAVFVSWFDAYWFSRFIGEVEVNGGKYRVTLPTEAQWEYSARAGCDGDYFYAGRDENDSSKGYFEVNKESLPHYAHFGQDWSSGSTVRVDSKLPNLWGLRMAGNLTQWTLDGWQDELRGGKDPLATGGLGSFRVGRGGGWGLGAADCRSALRDGVGPWGRYGGYGFRVALSPSGIPKTAEQQSGIRIE